MGLIITILLVVLAIAALVFLAKVLATVAVVVLGLIAAYLIYRKISGGGTAPAAGA